MLKNPITGVCDGSCWNNFWMQDTICFPEQKYQNQLRFLPEWGSKRKSNLAGRIFQKNCLYFSRSGRQHMLQSRQSYCVTGIVLGSRARTCSLKVILTKANEPTVWIPLQQLVLSNSHQTLDRGRQPYTENDRISISTTWVRAEAATKRLEGYIHAKRTHLAISWLSDCTSLIKITSEYSPHS